MMRPADGERHDMIYFIPFRACRIHGYDRRVQSWAMRADNKPRRNPVLVSPIAGFPFVGPCLFFTTHCSISPCIGGDCPNMRGILLGH